jgi:methionyl-tRNA formyltransferase
VRRLRHYELDLILCVGFDRLFSPEILMTARLGGINAHPSRLPALRGPAPIFWALRTGLRELAVTLHALDRREDHGSIFAVEPFGLPHGADGPELYRIAGDLAGRMMLALLGQLSDRLPRGTPQVDSLATRAPRARPEDVQIEPKAWRAQHLLDFACGAPYFRTPFVRFGDESGGDTFFIRRGLSFDLGRPLPAQYVLSGSTLVVQCEDGVVHLEIQV